MTLKWRLNFHFASNAVFFCVDGSAVDMIKVIFLNSAAGKWTTNPHVQNGGYSAFKTLTLDARQIVLGDTVGCAPVAERGRCLKNERKTREKRLIWVRFRNVCPDGIVRQTLSHLRQSLLKRPDEGSRTSYHYLCNSVGVLPDDRSRGLAIFSDLCLS